MDPVLWQVPLMVFLVLVSIGLAGAVVRWLFERVF